MYIEFDDPGNRFKRKRILIKRLLPLAGESPGWQCEVSGKSETGSHQYKLANLTAEQVEEIRLQILALYERLMQAKRFAKKKEPGVEPGSA